MDIKFGYKKNGRGVIRANAKARSTHMHVIGSPGTGKSKFLEHLMREDIKAGHGLCLIDPHGGLYEDVVRFCSQNPHTKKKLVLLDATADGWSFGFNPLNFQNKNSEDRAFYIDGLLRATIQVPDQDADKMTLLTRGLRSIYHVMASHGLTLCEADTLVAYKDTENIRKYLTENLDDYQQTKEWKRYNELSSRDFTAEFQSSHGRLFKFLDSERLRNIFGQSKKILNIRKCMDEGSVVLVNLSQGGDKLSRDAGNLLGRFLINNLFKTALTRGKKEFGGKEPRPFYLYIDECHQYITEDITSILNETRKFGLHMILAHQNLKQLEAVSEVVKDSVMGSARIKVVFGGLSPVDAKEMSEVVFRGELDLEEPKHILDKPVVVGEEIIWLESESESKGSSESSMQSTSTGESESFAPDGTFLGMIAKDGDLLGTVSAEGGGTSTSHSSSSSVTCGRAQAFKSIREERPGAVYNLDEQIHKAATTLAQLPQAEAIVKVLNKQSIHFKVPVVKPPYATARHVAKFKEKVYELSGCVSSTKLVKQELEERRQKLLRDAGAPAQTEREAEEPTDYWEG